MKSWIGLLSLVGLSGCVHTTTADRSMVVRDVGDAMNACRQYTDQQLPELTGISIDRLSSREHKKLYDIYLDITDGHQRGYVRCQVAKGQSGGVTYHAVRDFVRDARSFAG